MDDLEIKLVHDNWINPQQFQLVREEAKKLAKSFWSVLIRNKYMSCEDVALFFAQEAGIPYVKLADYKISPQVLKLIDEEFCRRNCLIPAFKVKDVLFVACANPCDTAIMDDLGKLVNFEIEPVVASADSIYQALNVYYGMPEKDFEMAKYIVKSEPLKGLRFWRESERITLNIPVGIRVEDRNTVLNYSSTIEGFTNDISRNGTALGLQVFSFIPRGINISLEFKPDGKLSASEKVIKAKGEVVYCRMQKNRHYFLGVKFTGITQEDLNELFKIAGRSGPL